MDSPTFGLLRKGPPLPFSPSAPFGGGLLRPPPLPLPDFRGRTLLPSPPFPVFIPTNTHSLPYHHTSRGDRCVTCSLTTSDTTTHCTLHFYLYNLLHKNSPTWLPHRPQSWPWRSKWPSSSNFNNLNNLNNLLPRERERGHSHLEATSRHSSTCRP